MDSVQETPAKRRKIDAGQITSNNGYDSGDDSGENLFDDYETVDTVPLPRIPPGRGPSSSLAALSPIHHVTQPTQILNKATPASNRNTSPSVIQVAASSPLAELTVPSPSPVVQRLGGSLGNRMAPPGTAFRSPAGIQKPNPVVDLSSDDDDRPMYRGSSSDEESQSSRKADIKPSKFINSAQNDVGAVNTNRFKEITTKSFYKPLRNSKPDQQPPPSLTGLLSDPAKHQTITSLENAAKRSADVMADAYGGTSRPAKARQSAPAKALQQQDITLDEIQDYQVRTKVNRMHKILPTKTIAACKAALIHKKGNFDDAMDYLSALDGDQAIDLTSSDNDRPSQQPVDPIKSTAKQQLKAPAKSIQSKWTATQAFSHQAQPPSSSSPRAILPKQRKRLVQGRRNLRSPQPRIIRKPSPATPEESEPVDVETQSDSAIGSGSDDDELERKILGFLNSCTSDQLSDIAAITETVAASILSKRPFKNLDVVRSVLGDAKITSKRAVRRPVGDKIVDTCLEMWKGYDAVDGLVRQCESAGRPVAEQIKEWGVDVYGASNDGEVDLTNFDHKSEPETSLRDSGIGTPISGVASADEDSEIRVAPQRDKNAIFSQPRLLHENVVLKDYQVVGVNWLALLFEKKLSCILADDMGLGKTCQVIAFLAHLFEKGNKGPHLVIVPGSTIENWLREFSVFCPKLTVMPYYAGQTERINIQHQIEENLEDINVIVTTYGIAKAKDDCRFLRRLPLQVCVYDEGHILKNRKSAAYEQLTRFGGAFRLLLTGTPLQNNLSELVSLLAFILPQIFKEHSEDLDVIFSQKAKTTNEGHAALLSSQRISRARSMMAPFVLRRKKHQVLKHLPPKTRRVEWCELSPSQADVYNSERARGLKVVADRAAGKKVGNETANVMMSLRKASIHPLLFRRVYDDNLLAKMARDCLKEEEFKNSQYELCLEDMSVMMDFELQRFCERYPATMSKYRLKNDEWMDSGKVTKLAGLLTGFKENRDRVLVFSQFVMVMDILEDVMETLGMRFFRLDGRTKIDERQDMIDQFYADEEITVFLLSTKAGGAGINLACANKVVIFDSSFNPQDDIQAENRAHRVGQTREVEVIRLVTKGTIEEQIHALGQTKLALDDRVAGAGEATVMATEDEKQAEKQGQRAVEEMMIKQMEVEQSGK
ncbi:MAG: hypothetical protein LQ343_007292 [Gyalolechia ehrenbergii]|nr:MAG: hypothetical protein LQ343_007292 [Gyalolechia ehrenbergii]